MERYYLNGLGSVLVTEDELNAMETESDSDGNFWGKVGSWAGTVDWNKWVTTANDIYQQNQNSGGSTGGGFNYGQSGSGGSAPPPPQQKNNTGLIVGSIVGVGAVIGTAIYFSRKGKN